MQAVLTSASIVWNDGHIRVADVTRIKSSEVGTMLLRDRHANLHVITTQLPLSIGKRVSEQQVVERICDTRNGTQGPNEDASDDDFNEMTSR